MNRILVIGMVFLVTACGDSIPSPQSPVGERPPASGRFTLHVDAAGLTERFKDIGFRGAADVGFETSGCCGLALYAAHTSRGSSRARREKAKEVLDGGLELNLAPIPSLEDNLRMRMRVGKAGTPPYLATGARSGFAASAGMLVRFWDVTPAAVNQAAPDFDLLVEYYGWSLAREQTSAGPRETSKPSVVGALVFGVRVGLDYGIQLQ